MEQESSWVGLGWSLNPGAIVRNITEYPDDASGESFQIHRTDDNVSRGWLASLPGIGQIGWNNNEGHFGTISLLGLIGTSYNNGSLTGGNIVGVHFNSKNVNVDPIGVASAAMTIASLGSASALAETGKAMGAIAKEIVQSVAVEAALTSAVGVNVPNFNTGGFWQTITRKKRGLFHTNYWVWLDQTRYEDMYGTLYLQDQNNLANTLWLYDSLNPHVTIPSYGGSDPSSKSPVYVDAIEFQDKGVASDMHYFWDGSEYHLSHKPTSLAYDNYSVMGNGISGAIKPYRVDVGSLSMPRAMTKNHVRVALSPFANNHKVQFKYEGALSNHYLHPIGSTELDSIGHRIYNIDSIKYGIGYVLENEEYNGQYLIRKDVRYTTTEDNVLPSYLEVPYLGNNTPIENNRYGLNNKNLSYGKNILWFNNDEIDLQPNGFIDYQPQGSDSLFRKQIEDKINVPVFYKLNTEKRLYIDESDLDDFQIGDNVVVEYSNYNQTPGSFPAEIVGKNALEEYIELDTFGFTYETGFINILKTIGTKAIGKKRIGAYQITREDGMQYHYSLPIHEWNYFSFIQKVDDQDNITTMKRYNPFANTWLITGITGTDYLDRNDNNLIDENDWGKWIKFDYGFFNNYQWRNPYQGSILSSDDEYESYSRGMKQIYYLNRIQTRSHTAVFVKGEKLDGRGYEVNSSEGNVLKLEEILLFKNTDFDQFQQLIDTYNLSENYLKSEFNSELLNFINNNVLKKVQFHYTYDLCKNTPNSIAPNQGKLTLDKISVFGRQNFKVMPDYEFSYGINPNYNKDYWDGWGYYNSGYNGHESQPIDRADWCLTQIKSPLGSIISVQYERDDYSSIAGLNIQDPPTHKIFNQNDNPGFWECNSNGGRIYLNNSSNSLEVGDQVDIDFSISLNPESGCTASPLSYPGNISTSILNATTTYIEIPFDLVNICGVYPILSCGDPYRSGGTSGTVRKIEDLTISRKGGNVRVASITAKDELNNSYKTRYLYTRNGLSSGNSSGVVAQEPDYIKPNNISSTYDFYNYFDWPMTPVLYSKVTVLSGKLNTDQDYQSKQVYEFITPNKEMIDFHQLIMQPNNDYEELFTTEVPEGLGIRKTNEKMLQCMNIIKSKTSSIGQVKTISTYDQNNNIHSTTSFDYIYENEDKLGIFTESTIMAERFEKEVSNYEDDTFHRAMRTTKINYPYILSKITTTTDGLTSTSENKGWDFLTGAITKIISENPMGKKIETVKVPAYHKYPEMGAIVENGNNVNMLSQMTGIYTYLLDSQNHRKGLSAASIQEWQKTWDNYREINEGVFTDQNAEFHNTWRKSASYYWKGNANGSNNDGTYRIDLFSDYDYNGQNNQGWQKTGTIKRYDHYSMPIETSDMNENYSSIKMGYDNTYKIIEAGNASYLEVAYSGAEDYNSSTGYFGGEVKKDEDGLASVNSSYAHTGSNSLQISPNKKGFIYTMDASLIDYDKHYRASVWIHSSQASAGRIFYKIDNNPEQTVSYDPQLRSGDWYMINADFNIPASSNVVRVGCMNQSSTDDSYVDDFRFQPADATMICYVYNTKGELEFTINNDNLYIRYQYDEAGLTKATYVEVLDPFVSEKLLSEQDYNYAGQWGPN